MLNKVEKHSQLKERKYFEEKSFNIQSFEKQYFCESVMLNIIKTVARRKKNDNNWMARNNLVTFREKERNDQILQIANIVSFLNGSSLRDV